MCKCVLELKTEKRQRKFNVKKRNQSKSQVSKDTVVTEPCRASENALNAF